MSESKCVKLATGGTLTLRLDANLTQFRTAERMLLQSMIDAMEAYESATSANAGATPADQGATASAPPSCSLDVVATEGGKATVESRKP